MMKISSSKACKITLIISLCIGFTARLMTRIGTLSTIQKEISLKSEAIDTNNYRYTATNNHHASINETRTTAARTATTRGPTLPPKLLSTSPPTHPPTHLPTHPPSNPPTLPPTKLPTLAAAENVPSSTTTSRIIKKCTKWNDTNTDDWWQSHPDWEVSYEDENQTHTCFQPIAHDAKAEFFRQLYAIQFHGNCSQVQHRFLVGSGFAASMDFLRTGFWTAWRDGKPFQRSKHWRPMKWIYAPPFNSNSWAACESQDMFCYFLPISSCNYTEKLEHKPNRKFMREIHTSKPWSLERYDWMLSYMMRPNHITRQQLYNYLQTHAPNNLLSSSKSSFCTAMHVRRTDATTEQKAFKRNFYPLEMYLDKGNVTKGTNILLLTDDQSAIEEANLLHAENYHWYYLNRTRHRGNHGKNQHIPSGDEGLEILIILAEFRLIQQCDTLIHGTSNMVEFFVHAMKEQALIYNNNADTTTTNNEEYVIKTIQIDKDIDWSQYPSIKGDVYIKELDEILQNRTKIHNDNTSAVV